MFRDTALPELFCVPNTWFGVFDAMPSVIVQVALDGSYGKDPNERAFSYAGWFGYEDAWKVLATGWQRLLAQYQIEHFRSNELNQREDWRLIRESFGTTALDAGLHVVCAVPSEHLLRVKSEAARKMKVFRHVLSQLLRAAPADVDFALLCDREQDLAKQVAAWVEALRHKDIMAGNPDVYNRIVGICYFNSRKMLQVQAADLIANLAREQAEHLLREPSARIDPLLDRLTEGRFKALFVSPDEFSSW
jgi:hypothetical protein